MGVKMNRRSTAIGAAAAAVMLGGLTAGTASAVDVYWVGPSGGNWDVDASWHQPGTDGALNTGDDVVAQPTSADAAVIFNGSTVNLNTTETVSELQMSRGGVTAAPQVPGTARLNILPGANLQGAGSNGFRIGRAAQAGAGVGDGLAYVVQTGGTLQINTGTNGVRVGQGDTGLVADAVYEISGGSARGGPTNGSMTAPLQIGSNVNSYNLAEFHVIGSGATEVRFEDIRLFPSTTGTGAGVTRLHFTLDGAGVTPMTAEDELRFRGLGTASLLVDANAVPPTNPLVDIPLVRADRISTDNSFPAETFTGQPEGAPIAVSFGGLTYNYSLHYLDSSDDGVLTDAVRLHFESITPEPGSAALLAVGGLALLGRRRIRC